MELKPRWQTPMAAVVCVLAFAVGYSITLASRYRGSVDSAGPVQKSSKDLVHYLSIDPSQLDTGQRADAFLTHVIYVANRGTHRVLVQRVGADCSCTQVSPGTFGLEVGESMAISISIDLSRAGGSIVSPTRKRFETDVFFEFEDHKRQYVALYGESVSGFSMPLRVMIEKPLVCGKALPQQRFEIQKDPTTAELLVTIDPRYGRVTQISNPSSVDVLLFEITPNPPAMLGRFTFEGAVTAKNHRGDVFGPLCIHFEGYAEADVEWAPKQISLTQTATGSFEEDEVVLWRPSGESIQIIEAISESRLLKAEVVDSGLATRENYLVLRVTVAERATQKAEEVVIVRGRHAGGEEWKLPIIVSIHSNPPIEAVQSP